MSDAARLAEEFEILPCPFCGGKGEYKIIPIAQDEAKNEPNAGGEFIECSRCHASSTLYFPIMDDVRANVVSAWNLRAPAPMPEGGAEREQCMHSLRQAVERLGEGFMQALFDPAFQTPYKERFDALLKAAPDDIFNPATALQAARQEARREALQEAVQVCRERAKSKDRISIVVYALLGAADAIRALPGAK